MEMRISLAIAVVAVACGHDGATLDTGRRFLGEWVCDSGERELDCAGVVSNIDLASGVPELLRFTRGTSSDLSLTIPSSALVPGLPDGPSCELALNSPNGEDALLLAEPTCVDASGQNIIVHEGLAQIPWTQLKLTTSATGSTGCRVDNQMRCWAQSRGDSE